MTNSAQSPEKPASQSIRRKLGRGLGSLISAPVRVEIPAHGPEKSATLTPPSLGSRALAPALDQIQTGQESGIDTLGVRLLALDQIRPNPRQPRQHFDDDSLRTLAGSISNSGLMQPIVVRPDRDKAGNAAIGYQIIAGERRWRAAGLAGLERIPAVVRDVDDRLAAEFSLIENIQREDLNPMERAEAFQRLIDDFQLTHNEIAERVGMERSSVTNHLRLNELDDFTKDAVGAGRLMLGHAKVLLALTNIDRRVALAGESVRQGWSVRELERQVKQGTTPVLPSSATPKATSAIPLHVADLEKRLGEHLGTKVRVHAGRNKGAGRLIIDFYSLDQFEGLMSRMQFEGG